MKNQLITNKTCLDPCVNSYCKQHASLAYRCEVYNCNSYASMKCTYMECNCKEIVFLCKKGPCLKEWIAGLNKGNLEYYMTDLTKQKQSCSECDYVRETADLKYVFECDYCGHICSNHGRTNGKCGYKIFLNEKDNKLYEEEEEELQPKLTHNSCAGAVLVQFKKGGDKYLLQNKEFRVFYMRRKATSPEWKSFSNLESARGYVESKPAGRSVILFLTREYI